MVRRLFVSNGPQPAVSIVSGWIVSSWIVSGFVSGREVSVWQRERVARPAVQQRSGWALLPKATLAVRLSWPGLP